MKKVLLILVFVLVAGYLIFSASFFKDKPKQEICRELEIVVSNSQDQFVDTEEIKKAIVESEVSPIEKHISEINTVLIEEFILTNQHIKKAEVFITNDNNIKVVLEERKPIIRIIADNGANYYIDTEAKKMPLSKRYTAYLPVATGNIKDSLIHEELYKFALFLSKDKFWNAQIEQIVVQPNNDIEFIPRVGDHSVVLGSIENLEEKLEKLIKFYKEELNRVGWNKYSSINLKYNDQVVCTKK